MASAIDLILSSDMDGVFLDEEDYTKMKIDGEYLTVTSGTLKQIKFGGIIADLYTEYIDKPENVNLRIEIYFSKEGKTSSEKISETIRSKIEQSFGTRGLENENPNMNWEGNIDMNSIAEDEVWNIRFSPETECSQESQLDFQLSILEQINRL